MKALLQEKPLQEQQVSGVCFACCFESYRTTKQRGRKKEWKKSKAQLLQVQNALAEITGQFTSDDLLGRIFDSFCIGK